MERTEQGRSRRTRAFAAFALAFLFAAPALAGQSLTFQGRLQNPAGAAIVGTAVEFRVQILTPDSNLCALYEETQVRDLSHSAGFFSINLNDGTGTQTPILPTTFTLEQAVSNRLSFSVNSSHCASGTGTMVYSPAADANRRVRIYFRDPSFMGGFEKIPEMDLNPHSYAMEANRLGGFPSSSFLRVVDGTNVGNPAPFSTAQFTELQRLIGGTSINYMSSSNGSTTGAQLPVSSGNPASPSAGSIWFDGSTGTVKFSPDGVAVRTIGSSAGGSGSLITSVVAGTGLTGGGSSGAVSLELSPSGVGTGTTKGSATMVPQITYDTYGRITGVTEQAITGTVPGAGANGQILKSDGSNWTSAPARTADLKSTSDEGSIFPAVNCTAAQTMFWNPTTDKFECQGIALAAPSATVANSYKLVTVAADGRVNGGSSPTTIDGFGITDALKNTNGVPNLAAGITADRPAAGSAGRLYVDTQTLTLYRDNGSGWDIIGSAGAGGSLTGVTAGTGLTGGGSAGNVTVSLDTTGVAAVTNAVKVTTDAYGRVTGAGSLAASDIPSLDWAKITTGKPNTLGGYGISQSYVENGGSALSISAGNTVGKGAFGTAGRIYIDTQANTVSYDTGATWQTIVAGGGFTGSLGGEVSGAQGSTQVDSINGISRSTITSNLNAVTAATDAATNSTLVKRDSSGGLSVTEVRLKDGTTNTVALKAAGTSATYSLQLPAAAPAPGQSLQSDGSGVLSWVAAAAGSLTDVLNGTGIAVTGSGSTRTVSLTNTLGSAASNVGSATAVPTISVDQQGRITAISSTTISGVSPGGPASGDLSGTYPGPTVAKLQNVSVSSTSPTPSQVLKYISSAWTPSTLDLNDLKQTDGTSSAMASASSVDCTASKTMYYDTTTKSLRCANIGSLDASAISSGTLSSALLPDVVSANTYRSVTVDSKGRVTAGTNPTNLAGYAISDALSSQNGVSTMESGADTGKGVAPATDGRVYIATDTKKIYRSQGGAWVEIVSASGSGGTITDVKVDATLSRSVSGTEITVGMPNKGTADTYYKVTTDAQGRVISGSTSLVAADIPNLAWSKITGTPTTLGGYGIAKNYVENSGSAVSIAAGNTVGKGSAATAGRIYIDTQANTVSYDTGSVWQTIVSGGGFTGSLGGEVSGAQGSTQVDSINGISRATITSNMNAVTAATDVATNSTIVKRDGTGGFSATELRLKDSTTNLVKLKAAATSANYSLQFPAAAPTNGQSLQSDASGVLSWVTAAAGSLTNILQGTGINVTGSGATRTVTLADTAVTPNTYGSATTVPQIIVDQQGRITGATPVTISGVSPGGSASGDLSGTYPGPTVAKIQNVTVNSTSPGLGQVLKYASSNWVASTLDLNDLKQNDNTTSAMANASSVDCTASKVMYYDTTTKSLRCQNASIAASSQITGILPVANGGTGVNASSVAQNYVFAAPSSGAGAPTFRALTATDLPASASYWSSATGGINYAGGNVGIGTTTPGAKLSLGAFTGDIIRLYDMGGAANNYGIGIIGSTMQNFVPAGGSFTFNSGGTTQAAGTNEVMRINATGSVGIGTTNPSRPLEVATAGGVPLRVTTGTSQKVSIEGYNSAGAAFVIGQIQSNPHLTLSNEMASGDVEFRTGGGVEKMRITSGGNVGIGTALPDSPLHIVKTSAGAEVIGMHLQNNDSSTVNTGITIDLNPSAVSAGTRSAQIAAVASPAAHQSNLIFRTSFANPPTEKMRIDYAGNVGIGTSSPGQKLSVAGTIETTSGGVKFPDTTTQTTAAIITPWANAGAVTLTAVTTSPTKGTNTTDAMRWRRVGDTMEINWNYVQTAAGTAGSGYYLIAIPNGMAIDTSKFSVPSSSINRMARVGTITIAYGSGGRCDGAVYAYNTTKLFAEVTCESSGSTASGAWGSTYLGLTFTPQQIGITAAFPISGW